MADSLISNQARALNALRMAKHVARGDEKKQGEIDKKISVNECKLGDLYLLYKDSADNARIHYEVALKADKENKDALSGLVKIGLIKSDQKMFMENMIKLSDMALDVKKIFSAETIQEIENALRVVVEDMLGQKNTFSATEAYIILKGLTGKDEKKLADDIIKSETTYIETLLEKEEKEKVKKMEDAKQCERKGDIYRFLGNKDLAKTLYERALAVDKKSIKAILGLALLKLDAGVSREAVKLLNKIRGENSVKKDVSGALFNAYIKMNDINKAREVFNELKEINVMTDDMKNIFVTLLKKEIALVEKSGAKNMKALEKLNALYQELVKLNPDSKEALDAEYNGKISIINVHRAKDENNDVIEKASALKEKLLREKKKDENRINFLNEILIESYEKIIADKKASKEARADSYNQLVTLYAENSMKLSDSRAKEDAVKKILYTLENAEALGKKLPANTLALISKLMLEISEVYEKSGDIENALTFYSDIVKIDNSNSGAHIYLAKHAESKNDIDRAIEEYEKAFNAKGAGREFAGEKLVELYLRSDKNIDKANKILNELFKREVDIDAKAREAVRAKDDLFKKIEDIDTELRALEKILEEKIRGEVIDKQEIKNLENRFNDLEVFKKDINTRLEDLKTQEKPVVTAKSREAVIIETAYRKAAQEYLNLMSEKKSILKKITTEKEARLKEINDRLITIEMAHVNFLEKTIETTLVWAETYLKTNEIDKARGAANQVLKSARAIESRRSRALEILARADESGKTQSEIDRAKEEYLNVFKENPANMDIAGKIIIGESKIFEAVEFLFSRGAEKELIGFLNLAKSAEKITAEKLDSALLNLFISQAKNVIDVKLLGIMIDLVHEKSNFDFMNNIYANQNLNEIDRLDFISKIVSNRLLYRAIDTKDEETKKFFNRIIVDLSTRGKAFNEKLGITAVFWHLAKGDSKKAGEIFNGIKKLDSYDKKIVLAARVIFLLEKLKSFQSVKSKGQFDGSLKLVSSINNFYTQLAGLDKEAAKFLKEITAEKIVYTALITAKTNEEWGAILFKKALEVDSENLKANQWLSQYHFKIDNFSVALENLKKLEDSAEKAELLVKLAAKSNVTADKINLLEQAGVIIGKLTDKTSFLINQWQITVRALDVPETEKSRILALIKTKLSEPIDEKPAGLDLLKKVIPFLISKSGNRNIADIGINFEIYDSSSMEGLKKSEYNEYSKILRIRLLKEDYEDFGKEELENIIIQEICGNVLNFDKSVGNEWTRQISVQNNLLNEIKNIDEELRKAEKSLEEKIRGAWVDTQEIKKIEERVNELDNMKKDITARLDLFDMKKYLLRQISRIDAELRRIEKTLEENIKESVINKEYIAVLEKRFNKLEIMKKYLNERLVFVLEAKTPSITAKAPGEGGLTVKMEHIGIETERVAVEEGIMKEIMASGELKDRAPPRVNIVLHASTKGETFFISETGKEDIEAYSDEYDAATNTLTIHIKESHYNKDLVSNQAILKQIVVHEIAESMLKMSHSDACDFERKFAENTLVNANNLSERLKFIIDKATREGDILYLEGLLAETPRGAHAKDKDGKFYDYVKKSLERAKEAVKPRADWNSCKTLNEQEVFLNSLSMEEELKIDIEIGGYKSDAIGKLKVVNGRVDFESDGTMTWITFLAKSQGGSEYFEMPIFLNNITQVSIVDKNIPISREKDGIKKAARPFEVNVAKDLKTKGLDEVGLNRELLENVFQTLGTELSEYFPFAKNILVTEAEYYGKGVEKFVLKISGVVNGQTRVFGLRFRFAPMGDSIKQATSMVEENTKDEIARFTQFRELDGVSIFVKQFVFVRNMLESGLISEESKLYNYLFSEKIIAITLGEFAEGESLEKISDIEEEKQAFKEAVRTVVHGWLLTYDKENDLGLTIEDLKGGNLVKLNGKSHDKHEPVVYIDLGVPTAISFAELIKKIQDLLIQSKTYDLMESQNKGSGVLWSNRTAVEEAYNALEIFFTREAPNKKLRRETVLKDIKPLFEEKIAPALRDMGNFLARENLTPEESDVWFGKFLLAQDNNIALSSSLETSVDFSSPLEIAPLSSEIEFNPDEYFSEFPQSFGKEVIPASSGIEFDFDKYFNMEAVRKERLDTISLISTKEAVIGITSEDVKMIQKLSSEYPDMAFISVNSKEELEGKGIIGKPVIFIDAGTAKDIKSAANEAVKIVGIQAFSAKYMSLVSSYSKGLNDSMIRELRGKSREEVFRILKDAGIGERKEDVFNALVNNYYSGVFNNTIDKDVVASINSNPVNVDAWVREYTGVLREYENNFKTGKPLDSLTDKILQLQMSLNKHMMSLDDKGVADFLIRHAMIAFSYSAEESAMDLFEGFISKGIISNNAPCSIIIDGRRESGFDMGEMAPVILNIAKRALKSRKSGQEEVLQIFISGEKGIRLNDIFKGETELPVNIKLLPVIASNEDFLGKAMDFVSGDALNRGVSPEKIGLSSISLATGEKMGEKIAQNVASAVKTSTETMNFVIAGIEALSSEDVEIRNNASRLIPSIALMNIIKRYSDKTGEPSIVTIACDKKTIHLFDKILRALVNISRIDISNSVREFLVTLSEVSRSL
ncbi:hypothetical protein OMAG_002043 [Candidatus Omnitrophus magneticus]|uniref:Tetratricopeptide repeat protein n=1 Tax=Candidatus Omnitrophus magneticus TaxID=1609969 RepID=A0A0F0CRM3_9BACT|nr:hypothetical protein OMAG_002043 [Candidatus Omnitrophus magneticus]